MSALLRLFSPLRRAAVAFFRHDLVLRRRGDHVQLLLQEPKPAARKSRRGGQPDAAARKEQEEVALMLRQLAGLLDALPETRATLRHLCLIEHAVAKKGLRALHKLPLDVLEHALEQLEGLVTNWSPVGLASLRSKMAVAIIDREHMDPDVEADAFKTAAVLDSSADLGCGLQLPEVVDRSDDEALAAAYAALGDMVPAASIEMLTELGSPSAHALAPSARRERAADEPLQLRELQD